MSDQPPQPSQERSQPPPSSSAPAAASSPQLPAADSAIKPEPDLDEAIDGDADMTTENQPAQAANTDENAVGGLPADLDPLAAAPPPSKKETSLREFLGKMDEYAPIIPDAVTAHYLTLAGLPPPGHGPNQTPPHLARLLALATQKFVSDLAADSYQYARIRASNSSSANNPMGSLNAASGLNAPAGAGGGAPAGGPGGDGGKSSKANTHLGIQRSGFGGGGSGGSGQGRTVLTMEDLGMAVGEYGVSVKRGEFYR